MRERERERETGAMREGGAEGEGQNRRPLYCHAGTDAQLLRYREKRKIDTCWAGLIKTPGHVVAVCGRRTPARGLWKT